MWVFIFHVKKKYFLMWEKKIFFLAKIFFIFFIFSCEKKYFHVKNFSKKKKSKKKSKKKVKKKIQKNFHVKKNIFMWKIFQKKKNFSKKKNKLKKKNFFEILEKNIEPKIFFSSLINYFFLSNFNVIFTNSKSWCEKLSLIKIF